MISRIPTGAALVLVLGLSACGTSASGTGVATAPTTTTSAASAATGAADSSIAAKASTNAVDKGVAYAQCMRKHGVDMPDPTKKGLKLNPNGGGPVKQDMRKVNAAMAACKSLLPAGADLAKPPAGAVAELRALAKCMRANGIPKFPDPGANGQLMIDKSTGIDPTSAAFKAAQAKCAKYAPKDGQQQGGPIGGSK
jgi:hypothetical protein